MDLNKFIKLSGKITLKNVFDDAITLLATFGEYPMYLKFYSAIEYKKIISQEKTYAQLKAIHGLIKIVLVSGFQNERLKTVDKLKYYYKRNCGLYDGWEGWVDDKKVYYKTKDEIPTKAVHTDIRLKSFAVCTRGELSEVIELILAEIESNIDNMTDSSVKKYISIRNEMDEKSLRKLQQK